VTTAEFAAELSLHFARGDEMRPYPLNAQSHNFTDPAVAAALETYHQSQQPQHLQALHDTLLQRLPPSMRRFAQHFVANGTVSTSELPEPNASYNAMEGEGYAVNGAAGRHKGRAYITRRRGEAHLIVSHDNDRGGSTRAIYSVPDDVPELTPTTPRSQKQQDSLRTTNIRKRAAV
jgi:hypothetical protein